jgi:pyruvate formate lyase activating enzyme
MPHVDALGERCRYVPFITLSELKPRAWITLADCNFRCKGCFSIARDPIGEPMPVERLVNLVKNAAREYYGDTQLEEVVITGGEPTLDRPYLVDLISRLKESVAWIVLDTHGYFLDAEYLQELIGAGLREVMFDLKAWDEQLHKWYTGYSNRQILANIRTAYGKVKIVVSVVYIPGIVDDREIERIAQFLAGIEQEEPIDFRINRFRAELSREPIAQSPTSEEIEHAYAIVARYLKTPVIGKSCVRERAISEPRGWITVFPNGTMKRRTVADYRAENELLKKAKNSMLSLR